MSLHRISENLERVHQRIADAARRSGRDPAHIMLVAVTKYVAFEQVEALVNAGCRIIGESRPQELWAKVKSWQSSAISHVPIQWHLIGHLQRNKVQRTLPLVERIQSVDSVRLLQQIQKTAAERDLHASVLLEVNISGDQNKHGFAPAELRTVCEQLGEHANVKVDGLMGMAALEGGRERASRDFAALRRLRDQLRKELGNGATLPELSMGMSRDFDLAIAEGATIVRVGSALFEGVEH